MKLLFFIDSLVRGGAQRQLVNVAMGLKSRNHDVRVLCYYPIDTFQDDLDNAGVPVKCIGKKSRFDLSPAWNLARYTTTFQPSAVVSFLRTPSVYAELARIKNRNIPLVVAERVGLDERGFKLSDKAAALGHLMATAVTTNSYAYKDKMLESVALLNSRTHVIYNGLEQRFFAAGKTRINNGIRKTDAHFRFCVVAARPTAEKGLRQLVKAALLLKQQDKHSFKIDWLGPNNSHYAELQWAEKTIKDHSLEPHINFLGPITDVTEHYPKYDALILPSLYEGVANAMCEAMCGALPVLVSDIADNANILDNQQAGFLFERDNPEAIAMRINDYIALSDEQRFTMSKHAHNRGTALFANSQAIDLWESLLTEISAAGNGKS